MPQHYSQRPLTNREWMEIEAVLIEEMDIQVWYAVALLPSMGGEYLLTVQ